MKNAHLGIRGHTTEHVEFGDWIIKVRNCQPSKIFVSVEVERKKRARVKKKVIEYTVEDIAND